MREGDRDGRDDGSRSSRDNPVNDGVPRVLARTSAAGGFGLGDLLAVI